jgi:hypothetical protein
MKWATLAAFLTGCTTKPPSVSDLTGQDGRDCKSRMKAAYVYGCGQEPASRRTR